MWENHSMAGEEAATAATLRECDSQECTSTKEEYIGSQDNVTQQPSGFCLQASSTEIGFALPCGRRAWHCADSLPRNFGPANIDDNFFVWEFCHAVSQECLACCRHYIDVEEIDPATMCQAPSGKGKRNDWSPLWWARVSNLRPTSTSASIYCLLKDFQGSPPPPPPPQTPAPLVGVAVPPPPRGGGGAATASAEGVLVRMRLLHLGGQLCQ